MKLGNFLSSHTVVIPASNLGTTISNFPINWIILNRITGINVLTCAQFDLVLLIAVFF